MRRPLLALAGTTFAVGVGALTYAWLFGDYRVEKAHQPDEQAPTPGHTGYKLVDALLPRLRAISSETGIPLGLMIAWIAKESGGKLTSHTRLDERGYYQLMPDESKSLGLEHQRLSSDEGYSLDAGTKLIRKYQGIIDGFGVTAAPHGSAFYWLLVKLAHTVGVGQTKKWITAAAKVDALDSWGAFCSFVLGEHWRGPQPKKWLPFLDSIYDLGRRFGFGDERAPLVSGAPKKHYGTSMMLGLDVFTA